MGRLRFVRIALLAVVLLAGGLIVVIWSTTFVQTRLAGWALGSLQQRFGIVGHATRVELDLSRLALTVEGLSLAAEDHLDQPFFTVDHARVDLPWSSLWSDFALQEVALVHPQVTVVTTADGVSNLPSGGNEEDGDFAGPPAQVSIGSLDVRDLTVDWQDDAIPMRLAIGPTTLSLTSEGARIAGPLHLDGGAVLEVAGEQLAINEAEGRLTFDGSSLGLDQLTLRTTEGTVVADGRVGNVLSTPDLDLTLVGDIDLAAVAARVSGEAAGAVTITAVIRGSPSELSAAVTIDAETVQWDSLAASEIEGQLLVAPSAISIEMLTARVAGGTVAANGSMTMTDAVDSDLKLEWRDVDVDRLLAMLPQIDPSTVETSMTITGDIVATWTGRGLGNATMEARNRVRQGDRTGETRVSGLGGRWQIDADVPFADAARATGTAAVRVGGNSWHEWTIDGKFLLSCDALRECQETMSPSLAEDSRERELSGRLDAELTLAGSLGDPSATGSITASDVVVFGLPPLTVVTQASVGTTSLDVASAEIRLGDNTLRAQGRLAWDSGALEATAAGELADLEALTPILPIPWAPRGTVHMRAAVGGVWSAPVVDELVVAGNQIALTPYSPSTPDELPISGLLDFELSVSGAVDDLSGTARLHATDLSVDSYLVGTVDSSFTLANRVVLGRVEVPELGSVGDLTFDFTDAPQAALAVQLTNADLNRLSAGIVPLTGRTSADLQLTHRFDGTAGSPELELLLHRLEGSLAGTPLSLRQPGQFHYDANGVGVDRVDLAIGASHVRLEGGLSRDGRNTLVGSLEGPASDIGSLLRVIPNADAWASEMSFGGTLAMDFRLTGQPDAPQLSGEIRVDDGQVTVSAQPPVEDLDLRATLRAGVLQLDRLTAAWQDASLRATGTIPISIFTDSVPAVLVPPNSTGDVAVLRLEIDSITPTALAGYLDPSTVEALDGTLDVVIDLEATEPRVEAVRGSVTLPVGRLTISGVPLEQRRETRVEIGDGQLRVAAFDWGSGEDYLTLGGSITMGDDAQVDLSVTGEVDVRLFSALVPAGATAGHALLIANVQGPLDDPSLVGTIELTDAAVRMTDPRLTVSNLNGAILLSRNAVVIHEMTGEANGGRVAVEGTLTLNGFRPLGTVRLTGERMAMDVPEGLRTEVDADLVLALGADDVVLSGTATVRRGAYREPMTLAGGVLGFLEQRQTLHVVQLDEPGALDDVQLDLQVTTAEDIRLDNNYLNAALGANIRLGGTVGTPAVTGRIALRQGGRLRFGTREYEIETGVVDLVDPAGIEPRLDVRARTRASSFDISLSVSGGPGEFRTTLASDPPLPESDIVSVLLTGQTLSESGADGGLGAREQALGLVSTELLGSAGRDLGLRLRIGEETGASGQIRFDSSLVANDLDPTTRLTVGRQLNDQVTLIASQDLRSSDLAWIIDYLPLEDIEIRGLFSGDNNRAYEFRHALELGYPPSRTDVASGSRRAAAELPVETVEFVGETGFPAETLREVIRLRSGARFDFFRWQDDQDRIEQFYTERGYRQVRLRARRIEMPEVVSLEYDITRGPLTHLVVKGFDAPSSLRRALERAWERSVLDAFLLEEVRTLVRGHLSDLGFLRAKVDVVIDNTDNPREKTLTTTVEVGPQTTQREVVLNGSDAIDEETLWTFVTERELDSAVWSDPQSLEDSLVGLYRSLGWLEASVVVEEPVFEGAEARLPVRIEEGRRFSLGSVTLSGVAARSEQEALDVLGLTPGEPYLAPDIQAARGALERSYRDAGFSAARVSAEPTLDANQGTIGVEIRVREGLQQVVEDVVVVGRARSRPTLVTNALRITPGELVDLSEWNLARRRLYDTGVFRTVDIQAIPVESEVPGELEAVHARVVLEELPVYSFRYGLSITDQEPLETDAGRDLGLAFATDFSRRNLLGRAITAGVSARASRRQNAFRGYLGTTQFFGLPLATSVYAENRQETSGEEGAEFATHRRTVAFEQRIGRADRVSYAYSANFDRNRTFDKDPDPIFPFDITVNILRFTGSVLVDSRDNLFDASNGWFHSSTTEYGFEPGEGTLSFVKYFAQQYHYWPVGPIVLASAARLGLGSGLGGQLIRSERFFAGGGNTVRGYGQDSLGQRDFLGHATGGNALLVFNQEVRFPIVWRFRGVGFIDAGNVFETVPDISFADLAVGTGLGLRVETPVGLFRFDYGFALRRDDDEPTGRFFFSIGQAF